MQSILCDFNNKTIQPLETFHQNISRIYNEIINEFYNIKNSILENKKELAKTEEKYKESFMHLNELSQNIINTTTKQMQV